MKKRKTKDLTEHFDSKSRQWEWLKLDIGKWYRLKSKNENVRSSASEATLLMQSFDPATTFLNENNEEEKTAVDLSVSIVCTKFENDRLKQYSKTTNSLMQSFASAALQN